MAWAAAIVAGLVLTPTTIAPERSPQRLGARVEDGRDALRSYVFDMQNAPFPDAERENGYDLDDSHFDRDAHYADSSVSVIVPAGWHPSGTIDLVFFFHGWMSSRQEAIRDFDLAGQFAASGVRAILVVPETAVNSPDSYGGKFEREGGFSRFVAELLSRLDSAGIVPGARAGSIALAGHSGGYRIVASILRRGGLASSIREVWLFDALYARETTFADWVARKQGRFICLSARNSDTGDRAAALAGHLAAQGLEVLRGDDAEPAAPERGALFLSSESDHFGVVRDRAEFEGFLATSRWLRRIGAHSIAQPAPSGA